MPANVSSSISIVASPPPKGSFIPVKFSQRASRLPSRPIKFTERPAIRIALGRYNGAAGRSLDYNGRSYGYDNRSLDYTNRSHDALINTQGYFINIDDYIAYSHGNNIHSLCNSINSKHLFLQNHAIQHIN